MPPSDQLDSLDHSLIALLRGDGRAPVSKLATDLGVSRGTVQSRLDRLTGAGLIVGFSVQVRQDVDHGAVRAVMMIELAGKSTATVIRPLRGIPQIRAVHTTNGAWSLIAEISAGTLEELDRVLNDVRMIDGVLNSETSILLTTMI
jgi:DNA-binding Lrp family transcriptional regulator